MLTKSMKIVKKEYQGNDRELWEWRSLDGFSSVDVYKGYKYKYESNTHTNTKEWYRMVGKMKPWWVLSSGWIQRRLIGGELEIAPISYTSTFKSGSCHHHHHQIIFIVPKLKVYQRSCACSKRTNYRLWHLVSFKSLLLHILLPDGDRAGLQIQHKSRICTDNAAT